SSGFPPWPGPLCSSWVSSQPMMTLEPSESVTPGGTVTLSCSLSTGAITSSNYPFWFQQKPGSAPQLLIYSTNTRPSSITTRFSGSISSDDAALTITGVQAEDEADYYCAVYTGSRLSGSAHLRANLGPRDPMGICHLLSMG
uniref:Ig-like domain-containing protein n=1 Tax=Gopherus agassizii TaxID=38772 RepID=A0A452IB76_9SAUR